MIVRTFLLCCILLVSACGLPAHVVVLLPDDDGSLGAVAIRDDAGSVNLDKPLASVGASRVGGIGAVFAAGRDDVDSEFGGALAATPRRPKIFVLYFISGQTALAPGSQGELDAAIVAAKSTPNEDISVVGHADSTGSVEANEWISLSRALAIRDALLEAGIPPGKLEIAHHGANNPLVRTARGVAEPLNRRVEVTIR